MTQPNPLQELACTNCGAPVRTTAAPGATVTCDCCGSVFLIPERPTANVGVIIESGAVIQGDVVGGDKIVAKEGHVVVAGKGVVVVVDKKPDEDSAKGDKAGEGR